jgi:hypothetical protein
MIKDDETLILLFNPFVSANHKISVKLTSEFVKMSRNMIKIVPDKNTSVFVEEMKKILDGTSDQSFFSIIEMIEFFHGIIKQNSVCF